jgi:hypothetical protein
VTRHIRANLQLSNDENETGIGAVTSAGTTAAVGHESWIPPEQGTYKCKVDATIFKEQNHFEASMCIRNHR